MNNFESKVKQPPFTLYDNKLVQGETIFKNANQKLAYMYLTSYANANKIFPSIDSIATAICASRRTAINVIDELEEITLIEVKRTAGKSNNYILNDYFETTEKLTSANSAPVQKTYSEEEEKQDERTGANSAPVQDLHYTSANSALLPVQNLHPITKTTKITKENKKLVSSSRSELNSIDSTLLKTFTGISVNTFESLKAKLFKDAEEGKVKMKSVDQYFALMAKRLEFYQESHSKTSETGEFEAKKPEGNITPSEPLKANLSQSEKSESVPNDSKEVPKESSEVPKGNSELTKKALEENLKVATKKDKTPEEVAEAKKEIERLLKQLSDEKQMKKQKPPITGGLA